jgi:transcriptional regulator with XRE-family HTH domain
MVVASSRDCEKTWRITPETSNLLDVLAAEEENVAHRIRRLREAFALSQEAAAHKAGVTVRQWQRWENGDSEPYARNIQKISETFAVPLSELVGQPPGIEPSQLDRIEQALNRVESRQLEMLRELLILSRERSRQTAAVDPRTGDHSQPQQR